MSTRCNLVISADETYTSNVQNIISSKELSNQFPLFRIMQDTYRDPLNQTFDWQLMLNQLEKRYHNDFLVVEVMLTVLLPIISVFGIIGNSLVILVFQQHVKNSSSNFFIVVLGAIDLLICTFCIPTSLIIEVWRFPTYDVICKLLNWFRCFLVLFSPMLLILIAIDRCLLICFVPSKHIKVKFAPILLILIIMVCTCLSIPSGLISGIDIKVKQTNVSNSELNITIQLQMLQALESSKYLTSSCHIDERFINAKQFNIYRYFVMTLFFTILSSLILLYASIFTFIIIQHSRWKRSNTDPKYNPPDQDPNDGKENVNLSLKSDSNCCKSKVTSTEMSSMLRKSKSSTIDSKFHVKEICSYIIYSPKKRKLKIRNDSVKSETLSTLHTTLVKARTIRKPSRSIKTLKTLLLVSLSFILSFVPYLLVSTGLLFFNNPLSYSEEVMKSLLYYSYNLNSVLNPLIYSCMNTSFQKELKKLTKLRCRCTLNI